MTVTRLARRGRSLAQRSADLRLIWQVEARLRGSDEEQPDEGAPPSHLMFCGNASASQLFAKTLMFNLRLQWLERPSSPYTEVLRSYRAAPGAGQSMSN